MKRKFVIGARWAVRADSPEQAEGVIANMLVGLLGEELGKYGYLGTYQSVDPSEEEKQDK